MRIEYLYRYPVKGLTAEALVGFLDAVSPEALLHAEAETRLKAFADYQAERF